MKKVFRSRSRTGSFFNKLKHNSVTQCCLARTVDSILQSVELPFFNALLSHMSYQVPRLIGRGASSEWKSREDWEFTTKTVMPKQEGQQPASRRYTRL